MTVKEILIKYPESGLYGYQDENGNNIVVRRQEGQGCEISYPQTGKPKWNIVVEYDEDGNAVGEWPEYKGD